MRYFGVPTCPYCKKRVNLIRTWSLKRQGEYQCPRCGGISNIYLSPLIYILAMLAVFSSGVIYFFHKFILDDITLETGLYVFIPFAAFFLFSLFMVYLEKPVIKKISREEYEKRHRFRGKKEEAQPVPERERPASFSDEDFAPRGTYRSGPAPQGNPWDSGVVNQQAFHRAREQAEKDNLQISQRIHVPRQLEQVPPPARPAAPRQSVPGQPRTAPQAASPRYGVNAPLNDRRSPQYPSGSAQVQRPVSRIDRKDG